MKLFSCVRLLATPWPARLLHPWYFPGQWDFPGQNTGVGCHSLLQGIFPTQGSNLGVPHCSQTLPSAPPGKPLPGRGHVLSEQMNTQSYTLRLGFKSGGKPYYFCPAVCHPKSFSPASHFPRTDPSWSLRALGDRTSLCSAECPVTPCPRAEIPRLVPQAQITSMLSSGHPWQVSCAFWIPRTLLLEPWHPNTRRLPHAGRRQPRDFLLRDALPLDLNNQQCLRKSVKGRIECKTEYTP